MATAMVVITRLPTIGLSSPPSDPGGGVICVNTASEIPPIPFHNSTPKITTSHARPNAVAASDRAIATVLRRRRVSNSAISGSRPRIEPHQHQACRCQHDERDEEQDQAESDQRGRIK